jgi:hypothetical protein
MPKQGSEFFYTDADGNKQDADLHNPILRAAEFRVDEKLMAPIRAKHRARWLAEQRERHAEQEMQKRWRKARKQVAAILSR